MTDRHEEMVRSIWAWRPNLKEALRNVRMIESDSQRETLQRVLEILEGQATGSELCAKTYEPKEPGRPRETMLREAAAFKHAAKLIAAAFPGVLGETKEEA